MPRRNGLADKKLLAKTLLTTLIIAVAATFLAAFVRCGLPFGVEYTIEAEGYPQAIGGRAATYIRLLNIRIAEVSPIRSSDLALIAVFTSNFAFYFLVLSIINVFWREGK